jgi:heme/copper-type cytochrome/quinol oxidase subunit 2
MTSAAAGVQYADAASYTNDHQMFCSRQVRQAQRIRREGFLFFFVTVVTTGGHVVLYVVCSMWYISERKKEKKSGNRIEYENKIILSCSTEIE